MNRARNWYSADGRFETEIDAALERVAEAPFAFRQSCGRGDLGQPSYGRDFHCAAES